MDKVNRILIKKGKMKKKMKMKHNNQNPINRISQMIAIAIVIPKKEINFRKN